MRYSTIPLLLFTIWSCDKADNNADIDKNIVVQNQSLAGAILLNDTIVEEISFNNCFCNLTDKGVKINHWVRGTFVGQSLTIEVIKDSLKVYPHFRTWSDVGADRLFSATDMELKLNKNKFQLSDTVQGEIKLKGFSNSYGVDNDLRVKFSIDGNFKCILKDTSYTWKNFEGELIQKHHDEEWKRLKQIAYEHPDSITALNLHMRGLVEVPEEIKLFSKLKILNLSGNEIQKIDSKLFDAMPDLVKLDLSGNPINELPRTAFQLSRLEELNLSETKMVNLTNEIGKLKQLKKLNIRYTRIKKIPFQVFTLNKLEELNLPDTVELFKISNSNLPSLRVLWTPYDLLAYNKADIQKLNQLETLYPYYFYLSQDEYSKNHSGQFKWLEKELRGVEVSAFIYGSVEY